jgi:hypothetical protein
MSCSPSYNRIFSIADAATSVALISLGCFSFTDLPIGAEFQFSRIILGFYLVLAGSVLTLSSTLDIPLLRKILPSIYSYLGKGFIGTLFGTLALGTSKISIPLSVTVIAWSLICLCLSFLSTRPPTPLLSCSSTSEFPPSSSSQTQGQTNGVSSVIVNKEAPRSWRLEGSQQSMSQPKPNPFGSALHSISNGSSGAVPNPFNQGLADAAYTPPHPFRNDTS